MSDEHDQEQTVFPEPPQGEFDDEGRHVHPYVREQHMDYSAYGYQPEGEGAAYFTQMDRSRESRIAYHMIESFLGHLTPAGLTHLMQACTHRLYSAALEPELTRETGMSLEELDPRHELVPFEELHAPRLATIHEALNEILGVCPRCGRDHSGKNKDVLQPGSYVRSGTGEVVQVVRVAATKVHSLAHHGEDVPAVDRIYERDWFEANFVPAGGVELLPDGGSC